MCVIFRIYSDPSSNMNKNPISLQKNEQLLVKKQYKDVSRRKQSNEPKISRGEH